MNIFRIGSNEIQMLCWSVVLGLVQLVIATFNGDQRPGLALQSQPAR